MTRAMTARLLANRRNALRSSGPKTPEGKANSSKNAATHGLSAAAPCIRPEQMHAVVALARAIAGQTPTAAETVCARRVAEAAIALKHVRLVKQRRTQQPVGRARSRAAAADRQDSDTPQEQSEHHAVLQLVKLDRYERHAAARLKRALRDFGELAENE